MLMIYILMVMVICRSRKKVSPYEPFSAHASRSVARFGLINALIPNHCHGPATFTCTHWIHSVVSIVKLGCSYTLYIPLSMLNVLLLDKHNSNVVEIQQTAEPWQGVYNMGRSMHGKFHNLHNCVFEVEHYSVRSSQYTCPGNYFHLFCRPGHL